MKRLLPILLWVVMIAKLTSGEVVIGMPNYSSTGVFLGLTGCFLYYDSWDNCVDQDPKTNIGSIQMQYYWGAGAMKILPNFRASQIFQFVTAPKEVEDAFMNARNKWINNINTLLPTPK